MAITVYRNGSTHIENGIQCEIARIEGSESIKNYLAAGWKLSAEEVGKPDPQLAKPKPIIKKAEAIEKVGLDKSILSSVGEIFRRK